jgi:uncharacterized protein with GYD domain
MPKYMVKASHTVDGVKGLLKEGGSSRRATMQKLIQDLGGTLETFYYAFGADDAYIIADMPDPESMAAVSLAVNASGAVQISTTVLMTPEQMDAAARKTVDYRPPGG